MQQHRQVYVRGNLDYQFVGQMKGRMPFAALSPFRFPLFLIFQTENFGVSLVLVGGESIILGTPFNSRPNKKRKRTGFQY